MPPRKLLPEQVSRPGIVFTGTEGLAGGLAGGGTLAGPGLGVTVGANGSPPEAQAREAKERNAGNPKTMIGLDSEGLTKEDGRERVRKEFNETIRHDLPRAPRSRDYNVGTPPSQRLTPAGKGVFGS